MVAAYKIFEIVLLVLFGALISDYRKVDGSQPLVFPVLFRLLKVLYLIPFTIYLVVLVRLSELYWGDWLALLSTSAGSIVIFKARRDIGASYTWAGYRLDAPKLVVQGIYGYIRHPIYLGIILFIAGGLTTAIPRISWPVFFLGLAVLIFVVVLLGAAARHETRYLAERLGDSFRRYREETGAVIPRRPRSKRRKENGADGPEDRESPAT